MFKKEWDEHTLSKVHELMFGQHLGRRKVQSQVLGTAWYTDQDCRDVPITGPTYR